MSEHVSHSTPGAQPTIYFESDSYNIGQPRLMGRQSAGYAFLRAVIEQRGGAVTGYGAEADAPAFAKLVGDIDPTAAIQWIDSSRASVPDGIGTMYLPGPFIAQAARQRLRRGVGRYSLCGVTHTTATSRSMNALVSLFSEPVMPWDAVICTSDAVAETVRRLHEAQSDYLRWRLGPELSLRLPQLPVVPLGVHCQDFENSTESRIAARKTLEISDDEILVLFVGRLAFAGKAHPLQMYQVLQALAKKTGKRITLMQCGWFPTSQIEQIYKLSAAQFAPDVRAIFADGRDVTVRQKCWKSADIFISLSDNIQETFGLTPLEAMAAGLPVVVSDWNGYRQTVVDGVHGFRVPTWSPGDGFGSHLARGYEAGTINYDRYCWAGVASTSVDARALFLSLEALIVDDRLRYTMGEAGRLTAKRCFDWSKIYNDYKSLWIELEARRMSATKSELTAPTQMPDSLDPFYIFGHYPTRPINARTMVKLIDSYGGDQFLTNSASALFTGARPPREVALRFIAAVETGPLTVEVLAGHLGCDLGSAVFIAGALAKMGIVQLASAIVEDIDRIMGF